MKVALIACCKQEEKYIKEWIDWNLMLGIDHIYLADNNDSTYNIKLADVVQEYIDKEVVTVYNYNDIHPIQPLCYSDIYNNHGYEYDWFFVCDIDEFLHIPETNNNIKEFLNLPKFKPFDSISINWRQYDDNDLLYYDNRPVQERFTRLSNTRLIENGCRRVTKAIFKSKLANKYFSIDHYHDPLADIFKVNRCNVLGIKKPKQTNDVLGEYEHKYNCAYIAHYEYKTLEEYWQKINRGDTLKTKDDEKYPYKLSKFWTANNKTPEKIEYYNKLDKLAKKTV